MGRKIPLEGLAQALEASAFHRHLGLRLSRSRGSEVELVLPFREEFLAGQETPYLHGGVIAALIDTAACFAVIAGVGHDASTLDLRVDYFRVAGREELTATGRMIKGGRTFAVADAEVRGQDGRMIAVGRGQFCTKE